ncbi:MAG TPA: protein translocase subunit SecF [Actinomycetales bacterium]|nr:protein translocase subunit SecF [Actinomycetales bacterium]
MFSFAEFGNDLYTGKRSYDFVGRGKLWFSIGAAISLVSVVLLFVPGLTTGIEFRGGSEFRITGLEQADVTIAEDVVSEAVATEEAARATELGNDGVRVQTERLDVAETDALADGLAEAYDVERRQVTSSFVGPSWGQDITRQAATALVVFLVLVSVVITLYFRNWEMAVAALVALLHDLVITAGIYAAVGFEVTPATVIGFLTILGYSLYDTVVVFDKVRENTAYVASSTRHTYGEAANLAVNQTLVRSINTSVVALLPVGAILFIGAFLLGAGTLKDISLALFIGLIAGTYSSIFIATPLLVVLRRRSAVMRGQAERVHQRRAMEANRAAAPAPAPAGAGGGTVTLEKERDSGAAPAPAVPRGPRNQPKRAKRRKRR